MHLEMCIKINDLLNNTKLNSKYIHYKYESYNVNFKRSLKLFMIILSDTTNEFVYSTSKDKYNYINYDYN